MASSFDHIGRDIWMLHRMPYGKGKLYDMYSDFDANVFLEEVKGHIKRNIIAFSTKHQESTAEVLEQAGFKLVLQFYSKHGGAEANGEVIKMWRKYNGEAPKNEDAPVYIMAYNCSISNNKNEKDSRCHVWVKDKDEKAPEGYQRIGRSNLYIKINGKVW